jgi:hypothetical protein
MRVLVADDEAPARRILVRLLEQATRFAALHQQPE